MAKAYDVAGLCKPGLTSWYVHLMWHAFAAVPLSDITCRKTELAGAYEKPRRARESRYDVDPPWLGPGLFEIGSCFRFDLCVACQD